MFHLSALHAAARSQRVIVRSGHISVFDRGPGESGEDFYQRIVCGKPDATSDALPEIPRPAFMSLLRGDIPTTAQDTCYALYREKGTHAVSASDLLA